MRAPPQARTGAEAIDGPYAWFRLAVCMALATLGGIGMWAVVVILPEIQAEFGVDRQSAALPFTLTMIGFALGNAAAGRAADRWGVAWPLALAGLLLGAGFALAAAAAALWQFALVHGLAIGFATAASFGPLVADVSHWFRRRRGIAVAAVACGNYIAGALWPTVLPFFIAEAGWRPTYVGIGAVCAAAMAPLALVLRRRPPESVREAAAPAPGASGRPSLSPRAVQLLLAAAAVLCCVAMSMPQVHIVAYCVDLGYGMARGAEMLSLMLAGGIASRLGFGLLADRIGGVRTLLLGSVLQCAALVFYLPFDGLMSLYVVSLVFGLSQGGIVPSYVVVVREYLPAREAGQRVGIVIMASIFGMALGGWLSGWIYDATGSYRAAFVNGIAWNLAHIALAAILLRRGSAGSPPRPGRRRTAMRAGAAPGPAPAGSSI